MLANKFEWSSLLEYYESKKRRYFNDLRIKYLATYVSERHKMDNLINIVLIFCYDDVFKKYGRLIPTINSYDKVKTNQMGIMLTEDIDEEYLKEIESIFFDGSYEYKFYDYLHYNNIGKIDIKEIKNKYPNLNLGSIRDITLYSKNDLIREKLFSLMNCASSELQYKVCSLIRPIIVELPTVNLIHNDYTFIDIVIGIINGEINKKFDMVMKIINGEIDKSYDMRSLSCELFNITSLIKNNNFIYMYEFEYLFQDLLIDMIDKINEDNIDILLKAKEYSLQNVPEVTGELTWEPNYEVVGYECSDFHGNGGGEVYNQRGDKAVCTISYNEEKIENEKQGITKIIKMLIDGHIDYRELLKCDCGKFINGLMDFINDKEKVKKYATK